MDNTNPAAAPSAPARSAAGRVLTELAKLPAQTLLDETALSAALCVCKRTLRRMIGRGELPPPVPLAGRSCWLAGKVLGHIEAAADRAAKRAVRISGNPPGQMRVTRHTCQG